MEFIKFNEFLPCGRKSLYFHRKCENVVPDMKLTWLGHSCIRLSGTKSVIVDPFIGEGKEVPLIAT